MKKILFPTNFTELSYNAFEYAIAYAKKTKSKIIVYHTYIEGKEVSEETQAFYDRVDVLNFINKKDKFKPFESILKEQNATDVKVKYIVEVGSFVECIKTYIAKREDKIDLVIMGVKKNSPRLFDFYMETKTLQVLHEINKPVMAIPKLATFDGNINNIAFLVDYQEDEKEPLANIIETATEFDASLHVLHVDVSHGSSIAPLMENFKQSLEVANLKNVKFITLDGIDIKTALHEYCEQNNIDVLCLINHYRNTYQRLFSYSLAENLIQELDIPVMSIYRD